MDYRYPDQVQAYNGTNPYGSFGGHTDGQIVPEASKAPFMRQRKPRMNVLAIFVCLFVPWVIFCLVFAVRCLGVRYRHPGLSVAVVVMAAFLIGLIGMLALNALVKKLQGVTSRQPTWYIFLFVTSLLAFILALIGGQINYRNNMQTYYDLLHLNTYSYVDPSRMRGQQIMDAGTVRFVNATAINFGLSMSFTNSKVFCVAPISTGNTPLASYDFWAVGVDCCTGSSFNCGQYDNPDARAGLRVMRSDYRSFFRLAVQQAEAAYSITASHPLFFHWTVNPEADMMKGRMEGYKLYMIGLFGYFFMQLCLVLIAVIVFSRLGPYNSALID